MKNAVQNVFKKFGFEIHRTSGRGTLGGALRLLKEKGFRPNHVIDGGASDGRWSLQVQHYFPDASYTLVEALEEYCAALARVPNSDIVSAALGESEGISDFYFTSAFNSSRNETTGIPKRTVRMVPLDALLADPEHTLVKLDLEETEGPVIAASALIERVPAVIIECSFNKIQEYCALMRERGFVVYYIFDLNYRRTDGTMSQVDILFVPADSPLRQS